MNGKLVKILKEEIMYYLSTFSWQDYCHKQWKTSVRIDGRSGEFLTKYLPKSNLCDTAMPDN
jgi:hypothetical protein